jgi:hypothetical protein
LEVSETDGLEIVGGVASGKIEARRIDSERDELGRLSKKGLGRGLMVDESVMEIRMDSNGFE